MWGPMSRYFAGSRDDHTSAGSTTCASTSTSGGIRSARTSRSSGVRVCAIGSPYARSEDVRQTIHGHGDHRRVLRRARVAQHRGEIVDVVDLHTVHSERVGQLHPVGVAQGGAELAPSELLALV